jgi:protoporphyrinogen oxidase
MRIAVLGAGMTGLTSAYRLSEQGHTVDVYERWPGLGGQAATLDIGGELPLERYYHHLFTSDREIAQLYDDLGMPDELEFLPSSTAFFVKGKSWAFTSPLDLLRFRPLKLRTRIRMGLALLRIQRGADDPTPYEDITARSWLVEHMGAEAWDVIWGPLLRAKFGDRANDIAMVWLWKKFMLRRQVADDQVGTERLGFPRHSWQRLFDTLADRITAAGGRVLIDRPAAVVDAAGDAGFLVTSGASDSFRRGHDPRGFEAGETERYDAVISTLPNDVFEQVLSPELQGRLSPGYLDRLHSIEYHTAVCLVLELDRQFSPFYWTNIADDLPFIGLVEHANWVDPEHYGGRRILYVANYVAAGDPITKLNADELLAHYTDGLRAVNPDFDASWVGEKWSFREPHAQPIVDRGYVRRIPPMQTGVPGLLLANTTQVYPEDRGTNYAVRLGNDVAAELVRSAPVRPPVALA